MRTEDIVNKVFTRSFMGYDIEQVDRFLDEVIECLEEYEAEKKEMLAAMEYLLDKLEKGQKLPLGEMRKAIGADKPAKKRPLPPERALEAAAPEKRRERPAKPAEEAPAPKADAKAARSIGRAAGAAQKPAPKVRRVVKGEAENAAPDETAAKVAPAESARDGWFDELLTNLCERERQGYTPQPPVCEEFAAEKTAAEASAEAPDEAFSPKAGAPAPQAGPQTTALAQPQAAQAAPPAGSPAPQTRTQANAPAPQATAPAEPQASEPAFTEEEPNEGPNEPPHGEE